MMFDRNSAYHGNDFEDEEEKLALPVNDDFDPS